MTMMIRNKKIEDDMMNVEDMGWYKEEAADDSPGKALRFYRRLKGLSQPELAEMLGISRQSISDLENDRKPISRIMAKELSGIFNVPASRFITLKDQDGHGCKMAAYDH